jgi:hypothetical protein
LDLIRLLYFLIAGVLNPDQTISRGAIDVNVEILIDGSAEDEAAILGVIGGQIRATPA